MRTIDADDFLVDKQRAYRQLVANVVMWLTYTAGLAGYLGMCAVLSVTNSLCCICSYQHMACFCYGSTSYNHGSLQRNLRYATHLLLEGAFWISMLLLFRTDLPASNTGLQEDLLNLMPGVV